MGVLRSVLLRGIRFYSRAISPALPPRCRFHPTCSAYAAEAISRHGAGRGTWLALVRLAKCAPWHPGGVDFVPGTVPPASAPDGPDEPRPGTPEAGRSSGTAEARPASPADGARRPDPVPEPLATPSPTRRDHEESSVA